MNLRVLVTGGAGFIGSALCRALIARGYQVWVIDNLSTGSLSNVPKQAHFVEAACQNAQIYQQEPLSSQSFDAIYHLAGQSSGEVSFDDPNYDLASNTESTLNLLQYALKISCSKLIYASSMSVYGHHDKELVSEQDSPMPLSFYAVGKLASEHYLRLYAQNYGLQTIALRLFNVYGPGQNLENMRQGMVSIYLAQALKQGRFAVKGSLQRFRDFVYIDDVLEALLMSLDFQGQGAHVCNIATGQKTKVSQVLETISKCLNTKIPLEILPGTPGDQMGIYGSSEQALQKLSWSAKTDFDRGLRQMISWAQSHYAKEVIACP